MTEPKFLVSELDFIRLKQLLEHDHCEELQKKLEGVEIINNACIPPWLVTMESMIVYRDLSLGEDKETVLVYPRCPVEQDLCVSVLSPLGIALIGLEVGESVEYIGEDGPRKIELLEVVYQPETHGDLHPIVI